MDQKLVDPREILQAGRAAGYSLRGGHPLDLARLGEGSGLLTDGLVQENNKGLLLERGKVPPGRS